MGSNAGPKIPQYNNIVFQLDFYSKSCYPGSGFTVRDLRSGIAGTTQAIGTPNTAGSGITIAFQTFGQNQRIRFEDTPSLNPTGNAITMNTISLLRTYNVNSMCPMSKGAVAYRYNLDGANRWFAIKTTASAGASANADFTTGIAGTTYLNVWAMHTAVMDGRTGIITFYNNGIATTQSFGTGRFSSLASTSTILSIGNDATANWGWNGNIAISQIFDSALSDNDVLCLFNAFKGRYSL